MRASLNKKENIVNIPVPLGLIEGIYGDNGSDCCAIICAPHPHFSGTMHNKVVSVLTQSCLNLGINTLRFNYRGVGKSSGNLPTYAAALQDATFVFNWVKEPRLIWLGFSYGSYVASYGSGLSDSLGLVCVAPSVKNMPYADLPEIDTDWTIIQGLLDEVIDITANKSLADKKGCRWLEIPDASHFFHGKLDVLSKTVSPIIQNLI